MLGFSLEFSDYGLHRIYIFWFRLWLSWKEFGQRFTMRGICSRISRKGFGCVVLGIKAWENGFGGRGWLMEVRGAKRHLGFEERSQVEEIPG